MREKKWEERNKYERDEMYRADILHYTRHHNWFLDLNLDLNSQMWFNMSIFWFSFFLFVQFCHTFLFFNFFCQSSLSIFVVAIFSFTIIVLIDFYSRYSFHLHSHMQHVLLTFSTYKAILEFYQLIFNIYYLLFIM